MRYETKKGQKTLSGRCGTGNVGGGRETTGEVRGGRGIKAYI